MSAPLIEILAIGREILDGRVVDTNSVWLAEKLKERGLVPRFAQRVDDDLERVVEAFKIAGRRSEVILVTGGLGPTADDLTAEAFARFLGKPLEWNAEAFSQMAAFFRKLDRPMIEQQRKQALLPRSCLVLENTQGTAPGFALRKGKTAWYFMPGVPKEMKAMFLAHVLPDLPKIEGYRSSTWATQFTSEGELQARLSSVHQALRPGFEMTYRTRYPENHVGLHALCASERDREAYASLATEIEKTLGTTVFSGGIDQEVQALEAVVLELLVKSRRSFASVESCTGGLIADRITNLSGSSAAFWTTWVTYENRAKEALGVSGELLRSHGAVSAEVARAMAESGLAQLLRLGAPNPICVSTTGIAGPSGGSAEKPVGLCYTAVAQAGKPTQTREVRARAGLERSEYKRFFSQNALELVRLALLES